MGDIQLPKRRSSSVARRAYGVVALVVLWGAAVNWLRGAGILLMWPATIGAILVLSYQFGLRRYAIAIGIALIALVVVMILAYTDQVSMRSMNWKHVVVTASTAALLAFVLAFASLLAIKGEISGLWAGIVLVMGLVALLSYVEPE